MEGFTHDFQKPSFPVSPSVYAGLRYNITNRKGREVFIIELKGSCGLTPFYKQTVDYTLDGVMKRDVLKQYGPNLQLNIIVPLHTFRKTANSH